MNHANLDISDRIRNDTKQEATIEIIISLYLPLKGLCFTIRNSRLTLIF